MNKIIDSILNIIYPPVCGFCGKICKQHLCMKCAIKIKEYEINSTIKSEEVYFDEIFCIFKYKDIIRNLLIKYKFQNKPHLYKTFSKMILKNKKICGFLEKYDIIIPVPISKKRKRIRGYNQTELIAKEISINFGIKLENNLLVKDINTTPQSELNKEARAINVKNVFKIKDSEKIKNKNIIIFDDIYTTGNTVNECSRVLKEAGANKIGILTIAKD